jgi:G protein-coupled receptor Mth (Methuselah protein)
MSVCSFHMFRIFAGGISSRVTSQGEKRRLCMYMTYAYGAPIIAVIATIAVNGAISGGVYFGYATRCFLSDPYSLGLGFALPVILIIITNTVYFIIAARSIRRSPSVQRNNKDRRGFILYVKLFSLTGITWVLQIIDSVFPHSAFSFVVTVLIGCQGVFIFVSFICNKRVYRMYRNICRPGKRDRNARRLRHGDKHDTALTYSTTKSSSSSSRTMNTKLSDT